MNLRDDNEWHDAICVKHADGSFGIYGDIAEAEAKAADRLPKAPHPIHYNDCKYNYNRGQPIVDFGDFQMSIVDMERKAV